MLACLFNGMGAHWTVLQSVAWARMAAERLESAGFSAAVSEAISGRSPCRVCLAVEQGSRACRQQPVVTHSHGVHAAFEPAPTVRPSVLPSDLVVADSRAPLLSAVPPPLPPPRTAA